MLQWALKTGLASDISFIFSWDYLSKVNPAYFVTKFLSCLWSICYGFLRLTSLGLRIKLSRSCRMKNGVCNLNWVWRSERGMHVDLHEFIDEIDFLVN